ncbi:hypothetical protein HDU89_000718 [Geranomyces variabilis]|nr:hypothetical protein HDU89_000718 [Geranomyces variabilis]
MSTRFPRTNTGLDDVTNINLIDVYATGTMQAFPGSKANILGFESGQFKDLQNDHGLLEVNKIESVDPVVTSTVDGTATVSLSIDETQLSVNQWKELTVVPEEHGLTLAFDDTLKLNDNHELSVAATDTLVEVKAPVTRDTSGVIGLNFGKGLEVDSDNKLITNVSDTIKTLGALTDGGIASIGVDEALSYGFSSLGDLTDSIPDEQVTVIRLKAGDDFTQKTGALMMKNKGNNCVPYYGTAFDGLNTRDTFKFNDTLSTLSVPHVTLSQDFNPGSLDAVTQSYVSQFIQSGAAIDVAPEANNKRALNIRTDASLAVDGNNNLQVNPSVLASPTNQVKLAPTVTGCITFDDLEGSEYIAVSGNKISTTLKEYEAGENISITNGVISATVPEAQIYTAGAGLSKIGNEFINSMNITAGLGIIVAGSAETGYIISAESLKTKRKEDDEEEKTDDDTEQTLEASPNPEVIESVGAIASLVPLALTPLAGLGGIASAPAAIGGGLFGLLGGMAAGAAGAGLFGTLWSYEKDRRTKKNPDGSIQTDSNGNPVYDLDPNGNYQFDPADATGVAIVQDKTTRKSRLLFDSIELPTYPQQGMNYGMCWDFEQDISRPWTTNTVSQLISPLSDRVTLNDSKILSLHNTQGNFVLTSVYNPDQLVLQNRLATLESNSPITVSGDILKTATDYTLYRIRRR